MTGVLRDLIRLICAIVGFVCVLLVLIGMTPTSFGRRVKGWSGRVALVAVIGLLVLEFSM